MLSDFGRRGLKRPIRYGMRIGTGGAPMPIRKRLYGRRFSGFGDILQVGPGAAKLQPGETYSITLEFSGIMMPTESRIADIAREKLPTATIVNVNRGLFSGRFVITLRPNSEIGINSAVAALVIGMQAGGYEAKLIQVEGGRVSTQPGGLVQVASETASGITQAASTVATSALKPLIPWIIGAGVLFIGYSWWKVGGLDAALRPKQPAGVGKGNYRSERT